MLSWRRPRFVDESPECESAQTIRVGSQFEGFNSLGHLHPGGSKWVSNFIDLNRFVCILLSSSFSKVIFFKYFKFILKLILQPLGRNALNWTKCALFSTVFGAHKLACYEHLVSARKIQIGIDFILVVQLECNPEWGRKNNKIIARAGHPFACGVVFYSR